MSNNLVISKKRSIVDKDNDNKLVLLTAKDVTFCREKQDKRY